MNWTQWVPEYDPRLVDGAVVTEDEHGRLIESADCSRRCPGCGICCAGYRDVLSEDYFGVEEFEGNLKLARGGLLKLEQGTWYRISQCGESCPGYGQCCPPFDQRERPETVADARRILLEREDSQRWEMQEALLILAHDGSAEAVEVLEAYMPRAHTRLEGFAECALEEGRYFASVPHNAEEARMMMKREVLEHWKARAAEAHDKIQEEIEPAVERLRYELEIAQRLHKKAQNDEDRDTWRIQIDVLHMLVTQEEMRIEKEQEEIAFCDAMAVEIEADLESEQPS